MAAANGVQSAGSSLSDENDGAHIGDSICTECYGMVSDRAAKNAACAPSVAPPLRRCLHFRHGRTRRPYDRPSCTAG